MKELFESIKAFIEKGNIIIFLLAVAVAVFTYQVFAQEILWAIFAFCISYVCFYGIQSFFNKLKDDKKIKEERRLNEEAEKIRKEIEDEKIQKEKEHNEAHLRTLYESFPDEVKEGLEILYNLPQPDRGFVNSRIVRIENSDDYQIISNAYTQIRFNLGLEHILEVQHSIQSNIYTFFPEFYSIVEEKAKKGKD